MGEQMADRLIKAGNDVSIWNRTKSKADPLVKKGGKLVDKPSDLAGVDVAVHDGLDRQGRRSGAVRRQRRRAPAPRRRRSSSTARRSRSRRAPSCATKLTAKGAEFVTCPVSGNAKVIKAGKLSAVASGPKAAFDTVKPYARRVHPARRLLRRRGRALAHLQDRAQRDARRRDPEPVRDHDHGREARRSPPCLPRLHEQLA